jgi:hypothetical protein
MRGLVLIGLVFIAIFGCGSKADQLSRDRAKEIISPRLAELEEEFPVLCKDAEEVGAQVGL